MSALWRETKINHLGVVFSTVSTYSTYQILLCTKFFSVTSVETVLIYITPRPFGHKYDESPVPTKSVEEGRGSYTRSNIPTGFLPILFFPNHCRLTSATYHLSKSLVLTWSGSYLYIYMFLCIQSHDEERGKENGIRWWVGRDDDPSQHTHS
jgi:hypothetical protein